MNKKLPTLAIETKHRSISQIHPYSEDIMWNLQEPGEYGDIPLGIMGNVTIKYGNEIFNLLDIKQQL